MSAGRFAMPAALAAGLLVACDYANNSEPTFQGWVEADLIFVSPDETGRIETLAGARG